MQNQPQQPSPARLSAAHFLQQIECRYETRPDGTLFVPGTLNIAGMELGRLPDFSKTHIGGDFICSNNSLASLDGAPASVGGEFRCRNNRLACLEGAPREFSRLVSDFGTFDRWGAVPEALRLSAATRAQRAQDVTAATVLQTTLSPSAPLKIRRRDPGY